MNVVGIIAEYNPFHNGHFHHLETAKAITRSNNSVVVMSPNFVQRGNPAITDKWTRTKMALLSGADLVIELPTPYATGSAEFFAKASVSLLNHCQMVNSINFGSENNDIDLLTQIADILVREPKTFKNALKKHLDTGINFPSARAKALTDYCNLDPDLSKLRRQVSEIIKSPNNILGIEYLKALNRLNSHMTATTLKRKGSNYHSQDITNHTPSATAIRRQILKGSKNILHAMPKSSYELLTKQEHYPEFKDLSHFLCYRLLFSTPEKLRGIVGITEGLENRIYTVFKETQSIADMTEGIKSKRYTQTTVQRILLNIILQITKDDLKEFEEKGGPQYIRVLGFKKSSAHLLTRLHQQATLPIVMNLPKDYHKLSATGQKLLNLEVRATNIYSTLQGASNPINLDYTHPIVKV